MLVCLVAIVATGSSGCYRVHVRSGLPPGEAAEGYDYRWHHGLLWGLVSPGGTYDLARICPAGWAEIDEQSDLLTVGTTAVTLGVYAPHRVTLICARETHTELPPTHGYPPSSPGRATYPSESAGDLPPPPLPLRPFD